MPNRYSPEFTFAQLAALAGRHTISRHPCPICGPRCHTVAHQQKRTLCIWCDDPTFIRYACARCGISGAVSEWHTSSYSPAEIANIRAVRARDATEDDKRRTERALAIWREARDLKDTLSLRYLTRRGLVIPEGTSGRVLRHHPCCPFGGRFVPALLCLYRNIITDAPQAILRIGLTPDGRKIGKMDYGPKKGAAIKFGDVVGDRLCVGEGPETTIAGMMQGFTPAWALGGDAGIAAFPVLDGVGELNIFVDNDDAGRDAAAECAKRWNAAGRDAWLIRPTRAGCSDMADLVSP